MEILEALAVDDLIIFLEVVRADDAGVAECVTLEATPLLFADGFPGWRWRGQA